ncbi:MAG: hypothetical protein LBV22_00765 [Mycoplasmataceae bacterium]|jgi:hypothetical protein|nr:hypothetical protein [Mycoplasmataceae bacterium]
MTKKEFEQRKQELYNIASPTDKRAIDSARRDSKIWKEEGEKIEEEEGHKVFWPSHLLKK